MNYLITIIGPTAIGKTALSIALAKHYKCEIISCDSRQFYKEMNIGTAVPTPEELAAVKHHFIQHISIDENYSVGDFEKNAIEQLDKLFTKNNIVIMVGGSGLYADAILNGLDDLPKADILIRALLTEAFEENGISFLQNEFKKLDPEYYNKISIENPQTLQNPARLMRFIEVSKSSGLPYSRFLKKKKITRNFKPVIIGLQAERKVMYDRINSRVELMIQQGLIDEAQKLIPYKNNNALQTVGYRELFDYLDGKISRESAIEEIKKNTRRFAKRQITWFKRNPDAVWFDYQEDLKNIITIIDEKLN